MYILHGNGTVESPYILGSCIYNETIATPVVIAEEYQPSGATRVYYRPLPSNSSSYTMTSNGATVNLMSQTDSYYVKEINTSNRNTNISLSTTYDTIFWCNAKPYSGSGTLVDPYITRSGCRIQTSSGRVYVKAPKILLGICVGLSPSSLINFEIYNNNDVIVASFNTTSKYWQQSINGGIYLLDNQVTNGYIAISGSSGTWIDFSLIGNSTPDRPTLEIPVDGDVKEVYKIQTPTTKLTDITIDGIKWWQAKLFPGTLSINGSIATIGNIDVDAQSIKIYADDTLKTTIDVDGYIHPQQSSGNLTLANTVYNASQNNSKLSIV